MPTCSKYVRRQYGNEEPLSIGVAAFVTKVKHLAVMTERSLDSGARRRC